MICLLAKTVRRPPMTRLLATSIVAMTEDRNYDLHSILSNEEKLASSAFFKRFTVVELERMDDLGGNLWWVEFETRVPGELYIDGIMILLIHLCLFFTIAASSGTDNQPALQAQAGPSQVPRQSTETQHQQVTAPPPPLQTHATRATQGPVQQVDFTTPRDPTPVLPAAPNPRKRRASSQGQDEPTKRQKESRKDLEETRNVTDRVLTEVDLDMKTEYNREEFSQPFKPVR